MNAWQGLAGSIIGVIGAVLVGVWSDKKGYKSIDAKIGNLNNTTLAGQHNELSTLINSVNSNVKETITDKAKYTDMISRELISKVDSINRTMDKNEVRYENLNLDQKEVRNNVNKLVNSWEELIKENRDLKISIEKLKHENEILKSSIQKTHDKQLDNHRDYDDEWEIER